MQGKTLKQLRKEHRYTQGEVARGSGIPFGTYVGYELGRRKCYINYAQAIAKFYGISVDDIIFEYKGD